MSSKRSSVAALQRELLIAAVKDHNSRLKFDRSSVETLATTYAALLSLQRKKLIEPEKAADPAHLSHQGGQGRHHGKAGPAQIECAAPGRALRMKHACDGACGASTACFDANRTCFRAMRAVRSGSSARRRLGRDGFDRRQ
jgi:hypothetical protein